MLGNTTDSDKLARSIQRDYLQAAESYRMQKQFGKESHPPAAVRLGLVLTSVAALVIAVAHLA